MTANVKTSISKKREKSELLNDVRLKKIPKLKNRKEKHTRCGSTHTTRCCQIPERQYSVQNVSTNAYN